MAEIDMSQRKADGMELRTIILHNALQMEAAASFLIGLLLAIDYHKSMSFGHKGGALSFKQKINFLLDLGMIERDSYYSSMFQTFMEVRNMFCHEIKANTMLECARLLEDKGVKKTTLLLQLYWLTKPGMVVDDVLKIKNPRDEAIPLEEQLYLGIVGLTVLCGNKAKEIKEQAIAKRKQQEEDKLFREAFIALKDNLEEVVVGHTVDLINKLEQGTTLNKDEIVAIPTSIYGDIYDAIRKKLNLPSGESHPPDDQPPTPSVPPNPG